MCDYILKVRRYTNSLSLFCKLHVQYFIMTTRGGAGIDFSSVKVEQKHLNPSKGFLSSLGSLGHVYFMFLIIIIISSSCIVV